MALNQTREHSLLCGLQNDIFFGDVGFESKTATTVKQAIEEAESVKCVKGVEMLEIKEAEVLQPL